MTFIKLFSLPLIIMLFSACSIKQEVNPLTSLTTKEICIVNNPTVRDGFLATYSHELTKKGYSPKVISVNSPLNSCKIVSTYIGKWS